MKKKAVFEILKIGSSACGTRAKALIVYNEDTGEVRSGQASELKEFFSCNGFFFSCYFEAKVLLLTSSHFIHQLEILARGPDRFRAKGQ